MCRQTEHSSTNPIPIICSADTRPADDFEALKPARWGSPELYRSLACGALNVISRTPLEGTRTVGRVGEFSVTNAGIVRSKNAIAPEPKAGRGLGQKRDKFVPW